jgi:hypothetical protein
VTSVGNATSIANGAITNSMLSNGAVAKLSGTNTGDQDLSGLATNTALALKANTSDVNTSLALKANAADVTTSLALKANTSDLANKVDKVTGKELSSNDYTTAEKAKLAAITGTNTGDQDLSGIATNTALALKLNIADTASMLSNRFARDTVSLSSRIDSSVPYTGATKAVNLGAFDLTVNGITLGIGAGKINSNTTIGVNSLKLNTTGYSNSAFGSGSLSKNTEGKENTATGLDALGNNTTGSGRAEPRIVNKYCPLMKVH